MKSTRITAAKKVKVKNPILVEGVPGIGLVGKIAADYLIKQKNCKKIANIYSPAFPPQVLMRKNGVARMLGMRVYHLPSPKNDLLILVGDVQATNPNDHYEVCGRILQFFKKRGGKFIITLGGYATGKTSQSPKVFGAATHRHLVEKYESLGIEFGQSKGSIMGAAGLLLGLGKLEKLEGVCLMGETHGAYIDPKSAVALLEKLSKITGVEIDTSELEKKVKEGEKFIKKMEEKAAKAAGEQLDATGAQELSYIR